MFLEVFRKIADARGGSIEVDENVLLNARIGVLRILKSSRPDGNVEHAIVELTDKGKRLFALVDRRCRVA